MLDFFCSQVRVFAKKNFEDIIMKNLRAFVGNGKWDNLLESLKVSCVYFKAAGLFLFSIHARTVLTSSLNSRTL